MQMPENGPDAPTTWPFDTLANRYHETVLTLSLRTSQLEEERKRAAHYRKRAENLARALLAERQRRTAIDLPGGGVTVRMSAETSATMTAVAGLFNPYSDIIKSDGETVDIVLSMPSADAMKALSSEDVRGFRAVIDALRRHVAIVGPLIGSGRKTH